MPFIVTLDLLFVAFRTLWITHRACASLQPNPHDPLPNGIDGEWEAANLLRKDPAKFKEMVRTTLEGGFVRVSAWSTRFQFFC